MSIFLKCKNISILDLIEKYGLGKPEPKGRKYFLKSPINEMEKTPSFCIFVDTNSYFCYSTNTGGDCVKLVSIVFGLNALQSAKKLCQDFGIQTDENINGKQLQEAIKQREAKREEAFNLNRELNLFYSKCCNLWQYYEGLLIKHAHLFELNDDWLQIVIRERNRFEILCSAFNNGDLETRKQLYLMEVRRYEAK